MWRCADYKIGSASCRVGRWVSGEEGSGSAVVEGDVG